MRRLLLTAILAVGLGQAARAEDQSTAIRQVISDQIAAFEADDDAAAFTFASPGIRRLFGNPANFGAMVREGYPMVRRPRDVRFLDAVPQAGRMLQGVLVIDEAGALHVLEYEMLPMEDGWRIDGVRLRQPGGAGA
jgi:hypothetical protein